MGWTDSTLEGEVLWNQDFAITVAFTSRHKPEMEIDNGVWPLTWGKKKPVCSMAL
jgi:hypothetical protein